MKTKSSYEKYLNEFEVPDEDKQSNGGRIPDYCKYGSWIRRNDTIMFEVGLREFRN